MKKYSFVCLFVLIGMMLIYPVTISSCKAEEKAIEINLTDLAAVIGEKIDLSTAIDYADNIKDELGITEDMAVQLVVFREGDDLLNPAILFLIEAADKNAVKGIEDKLKTYKNSLLTGLKDYTINLKNEEYYHMVEDAEMLIEQQYIFWAVDSENKEINDIIKEYITTNNAG